MPPHLLAAGPRRLVRRALTPWCAGVFLKLVDAIEHRRVRGVRQGGADAESVDRRLYPAKLRDRVLVETAARKDRHVCKPAGIEDAADAARQRDEVAAVEANAANRYSGSLEP